MSEVSLTSFVLRLGNIDFKMLKNIPLDIVEFIVDKNQTYEKQAILYQQILKELKDAGLTEKYETQDKLFQELKLVHDDHPILNLLNKFWWDYGYEKGRVFYISCMLFVLFFILNSIFFHELKMVYFPDKFISQKSTLLLQTKSPAPIIARIYQLPGILLYTAYLFWGLKLDLKDLEVKHWGAITLIVSQYILGVICLAYLANYVLSK